MASSGARPDRGRPGGDGACDGVAPAGTVLCSRASPGVPGSQRPDAERFLRDAAEDGRAGVAEVG